MRRMPKDKLHCMRLLLITMWLWLWLKLFKKTLFIADMLLKLHNVPFKPSVLASCALSTVSTVASDLIAANLLRQEELDAMKTRFNAVIEATATVTSSEQQNIKQEIKQEEAESRAKRSSGFEFSSWMGSSSTNKAAAKKTEEAIANSNQAIETREKEAIAAAADAIDSAEVDGYKQPVIQFNEVFGATYLAWVKGLLRAVGETYPEDAQFSRLVPADHIACGKRAWVCKGRSVVAAAGDGGDHSSLMADSDCYRKFLERGEECLMIKVSYG